LSEVTYAQAAKAKKKSDGSRERYIIREGVIKGKDKTKINMEEADISGAAKTPMGTLINQNKADKSYDFINLRRNWHPEMIQSASSLEAGRNR
jgi:hypothetical protein